MILFDFDGTIVDVWRRYHAVFCEAARVNNVSLSEYRLAKLDLEKDSLVASRLGVILPKDYWERKTVLLESERYLSLDFLNIDASNLLDCFFRGEAFVLTKRRNPQAFYWELEKLGIGEVSPYAFVLRPDSGVTKREWLEMKADLFHSRIDYVIGDSPEDMEVDGLFGCESLFVDKGLKTKERVFLQVGKRRSFANLESALNYVRERV